LLRRKRTGCAWQHEVAASCNRWLQEKLRLSEVSRNFT
jgi:hypothetical protein